MNQRPSHFRLSLKALLGLVTVVALLLGFVVWTTPRDEDAARAKALREAGLDVDLEIRNVYGLPWSKEERIVRATHTLRPFPRTRRNGLSVPNPLVFDELQHCRFLEVIALSDSEIQSDDVLPLLRLPYLRNIALIDTAVDDRFLQALDGHRLVTLDLRHTFVTGAGLSHLRGSPDLRSLWVRGPGVTGDCFQDLATCPKLAYLWIGGTDLTGEDLHHLAAAPSLQELHLVDGHVQPEDLAFLSQTSIRFLTVTCKPSQLPVDTLMQSAVTSVSVNWHQPLDAEDDAAIAELHRQVGVNIVGRLDTF
ncbi:hypothetical protein [Bremerella cremea]|uniref:hypothetical protein n=1 Tax=Bremerella cremea TaxID=1031537 RepID=UPI0031E85AF2